MPGESQKSVCTIDGCSNEANVPGSARGWCRSHYRRWQRYGDPTEPVRRVFRWDGECIVDECDRKIYSDHLCQKHYSNKRRTGNPLGLQRKKQACSDPDCSQLAMAKGMCRLHYDRQRRIPRIEASAAARRRREEERQKVCEWCGKQFRAHRTSSLGRFCSRACKHQSMERIAIVPCTQCGTELVRKPSAFDRYAIGQNFCDHGCWHEWRARNRTAIRWGSSITDRIRDLYGRECVICGESRTVEYAHKVPARDGGTVHPTNMYVLCPTHHALLDNHPDLLTDDETSRLMTVAETWSQLPESTGTDASQLFAPGLSA